MLPFGPRGAARRSRAGLGVAVRGRHRGQVRRRPHPPARARAGADPAERHGRHCVRAQPRDPALQPVPRADDRLGAGHAAGRIERSAFRRPRRVAGRRAQCLRKHRPGRDPRSRGALQARRRLDFLLPHDRPAHRCRRRGAGVDLELQRRLRRAGDARVAGEGGGRAHRRAEVGEQAPRRRDRGEKAGREPRQAPRRP